MVSVIVATYNQRPTIARALDSVLAQQDVDFEVIIGDDCSTDGTADICRQYAGRYPGKVRLVAREQNVGVQANYYGCMRLAKGCYIADLAGDDEWVHPRKLAMQAAMLDSNPDIALCHSAWVRRHSVTGIITQSAPYEFGEIAAPGELLVPTLAHNPGAYVHLCSAMWRKDIILADLDRNPDLYFNKEWRVEDLQLTALMAASGSIGYIPEITLAYSVGAPTLSSEEERRKSYNFFLATTLLTRRLQEHYGVADADMAAFYKDRLSHMVNVAFGMPSRRLCRHAASLARRFGVSLTAKARLKCFILSPFGL